MKTSFITYATSGFGITMLAVWFITLFTGSIDLGVIAIFVVPVILLAAILYGWIRYQMDKNRGDLPFDHPDAIDPETMNTFLMARPEFKSAKAPLRHDACLHWAQQRDNTAT